MRNPMIFKAALSATLCLLLSALNVHAASPTPVAPVAPVTATPVVPEAVAPSDVRQLIQLGPGDSISVHVYGQPDMDGNVYVGDDGNISLPLLGPVNVAGLSPVEAAKKVEAALKSRQLLIDPHVEIAVLQSHSQLVSVLGEVKTPGRYPINPGTTVIELLAQAGGATENGADFVYVLRPDARNQIHRYTVDIKGIGDPNDPLSSAVLHAGDSVFVPRAQGFYILGEVTMPGRYRLEPGMTMLEAIARAGGVTLRGTMRRLEVKRLDKNGHTVTLRVKPDDLVQPDDNIRVKESIF